METNGRKGADEGVLLECGRWA
jgi:hypothetical protein